MPTKTLAAYWLAVILSVSPAFAEAPNTAADAQQGVRTDIARQFPDDSTTQHAIGEGADRISYTATAGTLPLVNAKGETAAKIFYVAYTAGTDPRPITFVFNGGPGAAAAFLHLGALGPRVLNFTENGAAPASPVRLSDNPDNWLPFTDLIFVDPVGTGFSRATGTGEEAEKAYFGIEKDADAMADFVRLYLTRSGRELSPVFLTGESYGGFRVALLAQRLLQAGLQVKGAILISPALEFSMLRGDGYSLLPLALHLPAIAASWLEMQGGPNASLEPLQEAEAFARTDYLLHLARGIKPDDAVTAKLARFTGLDAEFIARHHNRVDASLFVEEYERRHDRLLSRYDGTVSVPATRPKGNKDFDPVLDNAVTALTPLMVKYTREELGFKTDLSYKLLNREVSANWDFGTKPNRQGYAGSLDELQKARMLNPGLKVFIAHGYTDLVTTYSVSQFLIDQLEPIDSARPIELRVYRGGHMMYMRPASRHQLREDVRRLYDLHDLPAAP